VDGRPVRHPPTPLRMSAWVRVGAPHGPPQPRPAGHSPWTTLHRGKAARQPPRGGGGGAIHGAPLLAHRARFAGPPRTRGRAPGTPPPCPPHGDGAYPLAPGGSAFTIRGGPRWR